MCRIGPDGGILKSDPDRATDLYVGMMTGTSLDGVDAVLADLAGPQPRLIGHAHLALAEDLRKELLLLCASGWDELHRSAIASQHLARSYASAVQQLLLDADVEPEQVRAIGVHGQTVRHRPDAGYTVQLNAPATLAELSGIDVVADFRSRDLAAGGQGAPLLPAFHAGLFTTHSPRAVVNIGGISNVTGLPAAGSGEPVIGFDCGPGNVLIDAWAAEHLGDRFDRDGHWAAGGHSDAAWLQALLAEPYFSAPPPKSTGRELFNRQWLSHKLAQRELAPRDVQATLTRLTAASIGQAIAQHVAPAVDVLVCGGGAFNATLMRMLGEECAPRPVASTATLGVAPDHVEAFAFAWLAREHVHGRAVSLPAVTGARGPRVLGALYPAG
ncbi:MAG: anhydro-N-acetylmuramic acid kinase [Betaproteobacteria bacterium]|nr:MAG: anhydro-N-acetylmuramic acid kinase [Betaproteobacteria bacterium]